MRRKGFTLIELMIVIAIIGLLAAMLFPVFAKVREKARQAMCISNVRQISMGIMMYSQDFEGYVMPASVSMDLPATDWPGGDWTPGLHPEGHPERGFFLWQQFLYPYTKSLHVFTCPSQSQFRDIPGYGHYGLNVAYSAENELRIKSPSTVMCVIDAGAYWIQAGDNHGSVGSYPGVMDPICGVFLPGEGAFLRQFGILDPGIGSDLFSPGDYRICSVFRNDFMTPRHNGGVSVGFFDGHAKWMSVPSVIGQAKATQDYCRTLPYGTVLEAPEGNMWGRLGY